jgi:uncharacterized membrane protein YgcG
MRRVLLVRFLSFALAFGVLLSSPAPVRAQSTGTPTVKFGSISAWNRRLPRRQTAQKPFWVSRSDCQLGDVLTYPVTMTGYSGLTLQVWAGTVDCTPAAQRVGGSGSTCWEVFGKAYTVEQQAGGGFAVPLYARNIVNNHPPALTSTQATTDIPEANISVCDSATTGGAQVISLYFMLVDGQGTIANNGTAVAIWKDTEFDIAPPAAPTGIVTGGGEGHINVSWTNSTDSDIFGYNIYCDPPPGPLTGTGDSGLLGLPPSLRTLALPDAALPGTGGAGGAGGASGGAGGASGGSGGASTGGGGATSGAGGASLADSGVIVGTGFTNCAPTVLVASTDPPPNHLCGQTAGNVGTSGKAGNLVNGVQYVVGVAAVDIVGNVGTLSQNKCDIPVQVTDFFELYRNEGGQGGCSLSRRDGSSRWLMAALGALVSARLLRRRRARS